MPFFNVSTKRIPTHFIIEPKPATLGMERWIDALKVCNDKNATKQKNKILTDPALKNLLEITFSYSPYLTQSIIANPAFTCA